MRYKVVGPPGTGKTRRLLNEVQKYVKKGIKLNRIGYFAFTRKAANEARDRFLKVKTELTKKDIKYFQTLHSLAFNQLGLREENVMQDLNYKAIGESCGIQIKYASYETNHWNGIFSSDSEYLSLINLARVKQISPIEQFDLNEHLSKIERDKLEAIEAEIKNYKKVYGLIDFTDMIQKFLDKEVTPNFDVIFVDEAQDLSLIQWSMISKIEKDTGCDVWVAGDDDQAIFGWAGADVDSFINYDAKEIPLTKSERVPSSIQEIALNVINRIEENRIDKEYFPKSEFGQIYERYKLSDIDISQGDWLILGRTKSILKSVPTYLKKKGYFFNTAQGNSIGKSLYEDIQNWKKLQKKETIPDIHLQRIKERMKGDMNLSLYWYDAFNLLTDSQIMYMKLLLLNNEDPTEDARIKVSTIHGAKGGEATNVVLFLNHTANTIKGAKKSKAKQDEEYRVWYVGITRSMKNLYLIIFTTFFISCETTPELKYGGMFTGGDNNYELQQGSSEYASMIKDVVLGYADGNFEEIIENFSDSVTRREPGNVFKVAPSIERWEGFRSNYDSITRSLTSVMAVKVNDNVSYVDALFSQSVYDESEVSRSRNFERYWISHETGKIVNIAFVTQEIDD